MRAQYERDRLGYFYARYKGHELFSIDASIDNFKFLETQLEKYIAIFEDHNRESLEDKKAKILRYLSKFRNDMNEVQNLWNQVREYGLTSSNPLLHMYVNALREVEINTRSAMELLENEYGRLDRQLPPKESDVSPDKVESSQHGSDTRKTNPSHSRVVAQGGMQAEYSTTSDSYSSTDLSESAMAINDRVKNDVRCPSPYFLPQTTYRDPGKTKHSVERIGDRSKRQSLAAEATLGGPSVAKADKRAGQVEQPTTIASMHSDEVPGHDTTTKQAKASREQYKHSLNKDGETKKLVNLDETTEGSESSDGYFIIDPTTMATELRTNSTMSSGISSSSRTQSVSGIGLPKWQDINGWRESIKSSQKQQGSEKKFKKAWVSSVGDSVSMPSQPSSFIRSGRRAGDQPSSNKDNNSGISNNSNSNTSDFGSLFGGGGPTQPFQRTKRADARPESTPAGKLKTKPGLSDISGAAREQERNTIAQPLSQRPTMSVDVKKPVAGSSKAAETAKDEDIKVRMQAAMDDLKRSTMKLKEVDAALALMQMSRMGDNHSNSQQQPQQKQPQGLDPSRTNNVYQQTPQSSAAPGPSSSRQGGTQFYGGGLQYGGPVHSAAAVASQYNNTTMPYSSVPYGPLLYGQGFAQQNDPALPYGYPRPPHPMYAMGPPPAACYYPMGVPSYYHSSFQQGLYQPGATGGYRQGFQQHGAIGSEMQAMNQQGGAQAAQTFVRSQKAREQQKQQQQQKKKKDTANMDKSEGANDNPFVD